MPSHPAAMSDMSAAQWRFGETLLVAAAFAIALTLNLAYRLNPDVAWLYVIAEKCLHGAVLYRDIVAVNAPLASLILEPAVLLRQATSLSPATAIILYASLLALGSYLACASLAARYRASAEATAALKFSLFAVLFWLPGIEFGEREHLFCMALAPYLFAFPLRGTIDAPARATAFAIGALACIACNLKPPFALLILCVEIANLFRQGWRGAFGATQLGLFAGGIASLLTYGLIYPRYITAVIPWMLNLYAAYNDTATTLREAALWGGLAIGTFFLWGKDANPAMEKLRRILLVVSGAALASFAYQDKGWDYQAFPVAFCAVFMLCMAFFAAARRPAARIAAMAVIAVLLLRGAVQFKAPDYVEYHFPGIERMIADTPGSFVILTSAGTPAGRDIVETGHAWASRFPCLEMLPGIVAAEQKGKPSRWEAPFRQMVDEDFAEFQPPLVFVQLDELPGLPADFDLLQWFGRDPAFAGEWSHYRRDGSVDQHFAVFRRI